MKTIQTLTGKLHIANRLNNSVNGNPRYMLEINNEVFYTRPDSKHGYSITNFEDKQVTVTVAMHYGKLSLNTIEAV